MVVIMRPKGKSDPSIAKLLYNRSPIDFSEAVEHDDCSGLDCYELHEARRFLELPITNVQRLVNHRTWTLCRAARS